MSALPVGAGVACNLFAPFRAFQALLLHLRFDLTLTLKTETSRNMLDPDFVPATNVVEPMEHTAQGAANPAADSADPMDCLRQESEILWLSSKPLEWLALKVIQGVHGVRITRLMRA